jgi:hypothetical protein
MFDAKAFGAAVGAQIKASVDRAMLGVVERLAALEERLKTAPLRGEKGEQGDRGERGPAGADAPAVDTDAVARAAAELARAAVIETLPSLLPKTADIESAARTAVAALAPPERGEKGEKGDKGERGEAGADAAAPDLEAIARAAAALIEVPKDGAQGDRGEKGEAGKDADPELIQRMVSEQLAKLLPAAVAAAIEQARPEIAKQAADMVPKPRDGVDGRDAIEIDVLAGINPAKSYHPRTYATHRGGLWKAVRPTDALGDADEPFAAGWICIVRGTDDVAIEADEELRTLAWATRLSDGTLREKMLQLPVVLDRGVYAAAGLYAKGDGVTWDGSFWIAQRAVEAGERPGDQSGAWRMAVKKGRDGRDGSRGEKGERGADGADGTNALVKGPGY